MCKYEQSHGNESNVYLLIAIQLADTQARTHPVLVYNIRDNHELSILLAVVDQSHTPDLNVPGERHPAERPGNVPGMLFFGGRPRRCKEAASDDCGLCCFHVS